MPRAKAPITPATEVVADETFADLEQVDYESDKGLIYGRICQAMREVEHIGKKKQSSGVNYAFRSIEDVMNAVHPVLVRNKLFIVPQVVNLTTNIFQKGGGQPNTAVKQQFQAILEMKYRVYTDDGSFIEGGTAAESVDYSDKATQQAGSYCFKDFILRFLCVPTVEVQKDGDGEQPDRQGFSPAPAPSAAAVKLEQTKLSNITQQAPLPPPPAQQAPPEPPPSDEPPPPMPTVIEAAKEAAGVDVMTQEDWANIKKKLEPLGVDDHKFHTWTIKTLRANALTVPESLGMVTKQAGRFLWDVAVASIAAGELKETI